MYCCTGYSSVDHMFMFVTSAGHACTNAGHAFSGHMQQCCKITTGFTQDIECGSFVYNECFEVDFPGIESDHVPSTCVFSAHLGTALAQLLFMLNGRPRS